MSRSYTAQEKQATLSNDKDDACLRKDVGRAAKCLFSYQEQVRRIIRTVWPEATAKELAHAGNISVRQAERILGRQQGISIELLFELLENEQVGQQVHWAILDNLTAPWSAIHRHDREYIAIQNQKRQLELREELWRNRRL